MKKKTILSLLLVLIGMGSAWGQGEPYPVYISKYKYATFSVPNGTSSVTIPPGVVAYKMFGEVSITKGDVPQCAFTLKLEEFGMTDRTIDNFADESMILYSETEGNYTLGLEVSSENHENDAHPRTAAATKSFGRYSFDNMLVPSRAGMTCAEIMANMEIADEVQELDRAILGEQPGTRAVVNDDNYYYYKLAAVTKDQQTRVGFFWGAENGTGNFELTDNKAFLTIQKSLFSPQANARVRFVDETGLFSGNDEATGIELIPVGDAPELVVEETGAYDLLGRRVTTTLPGRMYIKNGRKFFK